MPTAYESDGFENLPARYRRVPKAEILRPLLRGQCQHPFPATPQIQSSLSGAAKDLKRYNDELYHPQALNEKQLVERNLPGYKAAPAAIFKLPEELLDHIFSFVCDENYIGGRTDTCIPAATLGQVCSFWRTQVEFSPRLWSTIVIEPHPIRDDRPTDPWRPLEHLLSQSGSHPLSVVIRLHPEHLSFHEWDFDPLECVRMLVCHCHRWLNVKLDINSGLNWALRPTLEPTRGHLPLLEHLVIDTVVTEKSDLIDVFQNAPKLRTVTLYIESDPSLIVLPWNQLQSLTLWGAILYEPVFLCSQLKALTVEGFNKTIVPKEDLADTELSETEAFSVALTTLSCLDFISKLTLPRLTSLSLSSYEKDKEVKLVSGVGVITSLLCRSSCTLTSLNWSCLQVEPGLFLSFLEGLPTLQTLSIGEHKCEIWDRLISDGLFRKLHIQLPSPSESVDTFLPYLQSLSLSVKWLSGFPAQLFVDTIKSRWLPEIDSRVECLAAVRLEMPTCFLDDSQVDSLQDLADAGLKIVVTTKSSVIVC